MQCNGNMSVAPEDGMKMQNEFEYDINNKDRDSKEQLEDYHQKILNRSSVDDLKSSEMSLLNE